MTTEVTQDTATPNTPASTPTQTGAANPGSTEAKFTQADVDRILKEKLEKAPEREARIKAELLSQLGLDPKSTDFDAVKSTIADAQKRKLDEMTEAQRALAERDQVIKERDAAIAERDRERAERRHDRISSVFQSEAGKMKAADAETVLLYAQQKHREALDQIMAEDGSISEEKTKKLLETIKSEKPVYFQAVLPGAGVPSNAGGRPTQPQGLKVDPSLLPRL